MSERSAWQYIARAFHTLIAAHSFATDVDPYQNQNTDKTNLWKAISRFSCVLNHSFEIRKIIIIFGETFSFWFCILSWLLIALFYVWKQIYSLRNITYIFIRSGSVSSARLLHRTQLKINLCKLAPFLHPLILEEVFCFIFFSNQWRRIQMRRDPNSR